MDKAKDKLGFDEKERLDAAKKEADIARSRMNVNIARSNMNAFNRERHEVKKEATSDLPGSIKRASEAGKKFIEAREAFMNTPLGKLQNAKDAISRGVSAVKKIFNSQRTSSNKNSKLDKLIEQKDRYSLQQDFERVTVRIPELKHQIAVLTRTPQSNPLPSLPLKTRATTLDEDERIINPHYNPANPDTSENCALCTTAYDLRRRGYDVQAKEQPSDMTLRDMQKLYKDASIKTFDQIYEEGTNRRIDSSDPITLETFVPALDRVLLNEGEGARGNLAIVWANGGGHSIVWEVENGAVVLRDTQINKKWKLSEYELWDYVGRVDYIRTDNVTPTKAVLKYVQKVN